MGANFLTVSTREDLKSKRQVILPARTPYDSEFISGARPSRNRQRQIAAKDKKMKFDPSCLFIWNPTGECSSIREDGIAAAKQRGKELL
jgi:hypothetical protein